MLTFPITETYLYFPFFIVILDLESFGDVVTLIVKYRLFVPTFAVILATPFLSADTLPLLVTGATDLLLEE